METVLIIVFSFWVSVGLTWSYDTVSLFANFFTRNQPNDLLSDYQAEFLSTHYEILSIEKCLSSDGGLTEDAFYKIASHLKQYDNTTKVLFYFNLMKCYCDCYEVTQPFYNNQSMWLYDDAGEPMYMGSARRPYFDMTQQYVRDWWVQALVSVLSNAVSQGILVDGVLVDGCRGSLKSSVSAERTQLYDDGIFALLLATKNELKKMGMIVVANGLHWLCHSYDCTNISDSIDAQMIEHFAAYEQLDKTNTYPNTYINVDYVVSMFDTAKLFLNQDIALYVKAWIGPETTPITSNGPSWLSGYENPDHISYPTDRNEIRNVAIPMLDYPLAIYLCGMYDKNTYFSYAWRWDLNDGYVPCPDDTTTCNAPTEWYPQFMNALGEPLSPVAVLYDGYKCSRTFQHAMVFVDLENETSANILWIPSTTEKPTISPTEIPTVSPIATTSVYHVTTSMVTATPITTSPTLTPVTTSPTEIPSVSPVSPIVTPTVTPAVSSVATQFTSEIVMTSSNTSASSKETNDVSHRNTLLIGLVITAGIIFCVGFVWFHRYTYGLSKEVDTVNDEYEKMNDNNI